LWSNTTNLIGHHRLDSPEDRAKVARILKIDESQIPTKPSLTYDQIVQRIKDRKIRALWVIATNPAHRWINQSDCLKALQSLEFLCVQDMYHNVETADYAHLILPAAGWGEKEGTFINSERRYGLLKKVRRAPGEALSDFSIFKAIAHYWGVGAMFDRWKDPEDLFCTLQALSEGQPCDITGIDGYEQIDRCGGIQWPWTKADAALHGQPATHRRLFFDGKFYHDDGRARLIVTRPQAMPELPDQHFPFVLLTGRGTASQWHTQSRTSKSPILRKLYPTQPYVEINRSDADRLSIKNGQRVQVSSRRGTLQAVAILVSTVSEGQLFMPMHYADVNKLTLASFDPYSRQPSYKNCAVAIQTVPLSPSR
jgi:assimilatory nitrate reductase catalytic subunit